MQKSVAFDGLSATGFRTAHVINLVPASFCRTDVRLRNTLCLGRFERYRLTGPNGASPRRRASYAMARSIHRAAASY
jgi:hypothetical protein